MPRAAAGSAVLIALALSTAQISSAQAADAGTPVPLGTTEQFAVLAGAGITNTGATTIQGDLGSSPTPALVLPGVQLDGTNQAGNGVTQQAKQDLVDAYVDAENSSRPAEDPTELAGRTLVAGVYGTEGELGLTGTVTLTGDSDDVFVFQAGSTLITGSGSSVVLAGDVQACNVFWQVGSSATFGSNSRFTGTVMALTDISAQQGARFDGRLLARNGAVTLINNDITASPCDSDDGDDDGGDGDGDGGDGGDGDGGGTDGTGGGSDGVEGGGGSGGTDGGTPNGGGTDGGGADGGTTDGGGDGTTSTGTSGGSSSSGDLPDTGGSNLWLLAAGLGSVVAGTALTRVRGGRGTHAGRGR